MNSRDFGKHLQELHDELGKSIKDLKLEIVNAKRLKTGLERYFQQGTEIAKKITDEETGLQALLDTATELEGSVNAAKTNADSQLQNITNALAAVQSNIEEMETAYQSFTEINEKITDEETGLQALLDTATELEGSVNAAKTNADSQLQNITNALAAVQSNIEEMETAYQSFTEINEKITDEETGLQASFDEVSGFKTDIEAVKTAADLLYKEIREFRDNAANYIKEIGGLKLSAITAVDKIESEHTKSVELKKKIEEIFNIGTRGVHANHFVERRNQLFWISVFWLSLFFALLITTIALAIVYVLPLAGSLDDPSARIALEVFLLRFSIITPSLLGALYALRQFSYDRRLYEKYAFKAISVYSSESSISTLIRSTKDLTHDDRDGKIIDFAVNTFSSLYHEPVEPVQDRWIFKTDNKILNLTAETNQSLGEIKEDVEKLTRRANSNE